jgi:NTP pyrophosphatase (non-canonical NTP hydrolase)
MFKIKNMEKIKINEQITIYDIQEWEKSFVERKGISEKEEIAIKIGMCKLVEEVGEVSKALIEDNWEEIQAELADVIIFACKMGNIAEKFHNTDKLSNVIARKINYCETRKYNPKIKKFDKPQNDEFK